MLVLSRKIGQSICLPGTDTTITVAKTSRNRVGLSIDAPRDVAVSRGELAPPDDEDTVVDEDASTSWRPAPKSRARQSKLNAILVAVSSQVERRRYAHALQEAGYRITEASDGLSCLSALRSTEFVMLVIDQHLLWGSGHGVVEVMRQDSSICSVPAVFLNFSSSRDSDAESSDDRVFGCDEIVQIVQQRLAGIA